MKAIIADIHGNLEALTAVLADIAAHGVRDIYCLGDIVGCGLNPGECVDLLADCPVAVLGEHDLAATQGRKDAASSPQGAGLWTRRQLAISAATHEVARARKDFLMSLPPVHREGASMFVHGSPRDPINEYIFPEDIYNPVKMESVFAMLDRYCFVGHSHIPGIHTEDLQFIAPQSMDYEWNLGTQKLVCNVGSVGMPRDGDPRACYVLLSDERVQYRRVPYDIGGDKGDRSI